MDSDYIEILGEGVDEKMGTKHRIVFGDALKVLKSIPDGSVDLVFADPPYNMSKKQGLGWKYSKHIS